MEAKIKKTASTVGTALNQALWEGVGITGFASVITISVLTLAQNSLEKSVVALILMIMLVGQSGTGYINQGVTAGAMAVRRIGFFAGLLILFAQSLPPFLLIRGLSLYSGSQYWHTEELVLHFSIDPKIAGTLEAIGVAFIVATVGRCIWKAPKTTQIFGAIAVGLMIWLYVSIVGQFMDVAINPTRYLLGLAVHMDMQYFIDTAPVYLGGDILGGIIGALIAGRKK